MRKRIAKKEDKKKERPRDLYYYDQYGYLSLIPNNRQTFYYNSLPLEKRVSYYNTI